MKFVTTTFVFASVPLLVVSCMAPVSQQGGAAQGGTYQDPNNPYAVPGVTTQGGYAPAAQAPYQAPAQSAPYQSIPTSPINPPATIPSYTPPVTSAPTSSSGGSSHTVGGGDTLWGLSRKYGVSVDEIRQANGLTSDVIITGQSLNIPR
ncbi:MAG: LysM peptidoglycan-binding domain-containing protein [Roseibacillus sp.]